MKNNGWIKLHRSFLDWEWADKPDMVCLFIHFLLLANHEPNEWQGQVINRGQFITGRKVLSKNTGISQQSIRTCITRLKSTNEITTKSTNKNSLITILNYCKYQDDERKLTTKLTTKSTNNQPAINQQLTTNNNDNNDNNEKNITSNTSEQSSVSNEVNKIFDIFYRINPGINFGNTTQRKAVSWLIGKFGFDKALKYAEAALAVQGRQYAPVITTPHQLKEKLGDLNIFYKKETQSKIVSI